MAFFQPSSPTVKPRRPALRARALDSLATTPRPTNRAPGQITAQPGDDLRELARQRANGGTIQQPSQGMIPTRSAVATQAARNDAATDEDATGTATAAPTAAAKPRDPVDELARQRAKAMAAKSSQLKAEEAQQQQRLAAASGLGGFGLSGASASAANDLSSKQARDRILALEDYRQSFERGQLMKDEQDWLQKQRDISTREAELATGEDLDKDGDVADGLGADNAEEDAAEKARQDWLAKATRKGDGTIQGANRRMLENMGFTFHKVNEWWGSYYVDQYGNKYEEIA